MNASPIDSCQNLHLPTPRTRLRAADTSFAGPRHSISTARLQPPARPQFIRRSLRNDPPARDDDHAIASRLHLRQNMRGKNNGVLRRPGP